MEQETKPMLYDLLKKFVGNTDVLSIDFKPIDEFTTREQIDFNNVRGSVRLSRQMIKTPAELEEQRKTFVNLKLP